MNVLVLIHSQHPAVCGADNMAWQTAYWLAHKHGMRVTLAHASRSVRTIQEATAGDLHTLTFPLDQQDWQARLRSVPFELIHLFDLTSRNMLRVALALKQQTGVPLVLTPATDRLYWECEATAITACRQADHLFVLTKAEAELVRGLVAGSEERISLLPAAPYLPPVSQGDFRLRHHIPQDAPLVLFLGRKLRTKGYELLLQASAAIWRDNPRVHLVLIGPDTSESQAVLAAYRGERRILALPQVTEEEKRAALVACDLLCLPSTADVFPLVFLEAWAFGKPVIASRQAGAEEVVRSGIDGLIVDAHPTAVAEAVVTLVRNEPLRKAMGEQGKRRVAEKHSWATISGRIARVYRQLTGS